MLDELSQRVVAAPIGMNPQGWRWGHLETHGNLNVNGGKTNLNSHVFINATEVSHLG